MVLMSYSRAPFNAEATESSNTFSANLIKSLIEALASSVWVIADDRKKCSL